MALIPDDPKQKQALAVMAVSLVVLYFANSLWYSDAIGTVESEEARVENMQAQNRTAQALAIRPEDLIADIASPDDANTPGDKLVS